MIIKTAVKRYLGTVQLYFYVNRVTKYSADNNNISKVPVLMLTMATSSRQADEVVPYFVKILSFRAKKVV